MAPGALDPLTKEMIYVAVSVSNQCEYCIASHTASARKKGMTDAQFKELMSVVGMANETNRLVAGYQVEVDDRFKPQPASKWSTCFAACTGAPPPRHSRSTPSRKVL